MEELKRRRSYVIAKITKEAGEANVREYMELMKFLAEVGFEGSVEDLFNEAHFSIRPRVKRSGHQLAEILGRDDARFDVARKRWIKY